MEEETTIGLGIRLLKAITKLILFLVSICILILCGITGVFMIAHIALGVFDYYLTVDKFTAGVALILLLRFLLFAKINKKS